MSDTSPAEPTHADPAPALEPAPATEPTSFDMDSAYTRQSGPADAAHAEVPYSALDRVVYWYFSQKHNEIRRRDALVISPNDGKLHFGPDGNLSHVSGSMGLLVLTAGNRDFHANHEAASGIWVRNDVPANTTPGSSLTPHTWTASDSDSIRSCGDHPFFLRQRIDFLEDHVRTLTIRLEALEAGYQRGAELLDMVGPMVDAHSDALNDLTTGGVPGLGAMVSKMLNLKGEATASAPLDPGPDRKANTLARSIVGILGRMLEFDKAEVTQFYIDALLHSSDMEATAAQMMGEAGNQAAHVKQVLAEVGIVSRWCCRATEEQHGMAVSSGVRNAEMQNADTQGAVLSADAFTDRPRVSPYNSTMIPIVTAANPTDPIGSDPQEAQIQPFPTEDDQKPEGD